MSEEKFERITRVRLPFDRRHSDPKQNYGINGLDAIFILKGPKGAIQFAMNFGVYLPSVDTSQWEYRDPIRGFDVGYHSPKPMYESQGSMTCDLLPEGKCYYDGSGLRADEWCKEIISITGESPDKRLWEKLEQEYKERFGDE